VITLHVSPVSLYQYTDTTSRKCPTDIYRPKNIVLSSISNLPSHTPVERTATCCSTSSASRLHQWLAASRGPRCRFEGRYGTTHNLTTEQTTVAFPELRQNSNQRSSLLRFAVKTVHLERTFDACGHSSSIFPSSLPDEAPNRVVPIQFVPIKPQRISNTWLNVSLIVCCTGLDRINAWDASVPMIVPLYPTVSMSSTLQIC
jgi:hypothetical protein